MSRYHEPYVAWDIQRNKEETIRQRRLFLDEVSRALKVADPTMTEEECIAEAKRLWKERMKHGRRS